MPKQNRIEENKKKNEHFLIAFDHFADVVIKCSQKKLAQMIGTESSRISELRNGKSPVNEDMIDSLVRVSAEAGMQIFRQYLANNSETMLLANVTEEEMVAANQRAINPDYDVMQARLKEKEKQLDAKLPYIDPASQQNASIAVYIQYTNRLSDDLKKKEIEMAERLAEKDAVIASLKRTVADKEKELERVIADKDEIIRLKVERISYLEDELSKIRLSDITDYHFPIGAAENKNVYPQK